MEFWLTIRFELIQLHFDKNIPYKGSLGERPPVSAYRVNPKQSVVKGVIHLSSPLFFIIFSLSSWIFLYLHLLPYFHVGCSDRYPQDCRTMHKSTKNMSLEKLGDNTQRRKVSWRWVWRVETWRAIREKKKLLNGMGFISYLGMNVPSN